MGIRLIMFDNSDIKMTQAGECSMRLVYPGALFGADNLIASGILEFLIELTVFERCMGNDRTSETALPLKGQ